VQRTRAAVEEGTFPAVDCVFADSACFWLKMALEGDDK